MINPHSNKMPRWFCGRCHHEWDAPRKMDCRVCGFDNPLPARPSDERQGKEMKHKKYDYCIPMMKVQYVLLGSEESAKLAEMMSWCSSNCDRSWEMSHELEKRWYPEFYFASRWDASHFMNRFKRFM